MPVTAPALKGSAIDQFMKPIEVAEATPVAEISAVIASEVASRDCTERFDIFLSTGIVMNPPPTPSKPDKKPVIIPENTSPRVQGHVHIKWPLAALKRQGGDNFSFTGVVAGLLW